MMTTESPEDIPILLLAAGSSSRMGQSKQLLLIEGKTLLQRTVETAIAAKTGPVIVVLGSAYENHRKIIENLPVQIVFNPDWIKGMGSSIKTGIKYLKENIPNARAFVILVCDQPHLSDQHLMRLAFEFNTNKNLIVASTYRRVVGVPILFDRIFLNTLSSIDDAEGAKRIVESNINKVKVVPFQEGAIDLDTMDDYNTFIQ